MNGTHIKAPAEHVNTMVQRRVATKTMGNEGTFAVCALTADSLDKCLCYDTSTNMAAAGGPIKQAQPMGARGGWRHLRPAPAEHLRSRLVQAWTRTGACTEKDP